ncbi:POK11 protein, partial [Chaetorhynchus papuensis]|nr:POK11 protein [Chaetorhynchus papuensis]
PIWKNQWSLTKEKLAALHELVQEQLQLGHIEPSTSPWNIPVFVIKKKSGKWRLLHDLCPVNAVIESMGALQPGMPSPTMIPAKWDILIVDLKDCFFTIPLHLKDVPKFAFTVTSVNHAEPVKQYQWKVLPQGMKNSPTICQWYVAQALSTVREQLPGDYCYHYMDDILVATPTKEDLLQIHPHLLKALQNYVLQRASEKVQFVSPWKYLGLSITERTIKPQHTVISDNPKTLQELHQLCSSINWVRPLLGLTTEDLAPLFNLLRGNDELTSPRTLTPEAKQSIHKVQEALSERQAHRYSPALPFRLIVLRKVPYLHGLIFQWDEVQKDPLLIIEWVFLSHQPSKSITTPQENMAKVIIRARSRFRALAGCDFECIYLPLNNELLEHLLQSNEALQFALDSFPGQTSIHPPKHKLFHTVFKLIPKSVQWKKPLDALTVFTDGSGASCKSVVTWRDPQTKKLKKDVQKVEGSPQVAELAAGFRAFERFSEPFNLVSDSVYVAGVVSRAEQATLKEVKNPAIYSLLSKLIYLISHREQPFFVMHTRSHTDLPGF